MLRYITIGGVVRFEALKSAQELQIVVFNFILGLAVGFYV